MQKPNKSILDTCASTYKSLLTESRRLEDDMAELRERAEYYASSVLYKIAAEKLESIIMENRYKILCIRADLERAIGQIPDDEARLIARLRVINGLGWEEIGRAVCADRTTVSKKYARIIGAAYG